MPFQQAGLQKCCTPTKASYKTCKLHSKRLIRDTSATKRMCLPSVRDCLIELKTIIILHRSTRSAQQRYAQPFNCGASPDHLAQPLNRSTAGDDLSAQPRNRARAERIPMLVTGLSHTRLSSLLNLLGSRTSHSEQKLPDDNKPSPALPKSGADGSLRLDLNRQFSVDSLIA